MREILFKGKRLDNEKWIEGLLIEDRAFVGDYDYHAYIVNHDHPSGCFGGDIYIEVDPETVSQYTGHDDMNGVKIFEGDIVTGCDYDEEDGYGAVYWDDGAFWVGNDAWCRTFCQNYNGKEFEVIGNIHDNLELREVQHA